MIRSSFATIVSIPTLNRILTRWKSFRITSRTVACELRLGETPRLSNAVTYTEEREVDNWCKCAVIRKHFVTHYNARLSQQAQWTLMRLTRQTTADCLPVLRALLHPSTHPDGVHDTIKFSEATTCKESASCIVNAEPTLSRVLKTIAHLRIRRRRKHYH